MKVGIILGVSNRSLWLDHFFLLDHVRGEDYIYFYVMQRVITQQTVNE